MASRFERGTGVTRQLGDMPTALSLALAKLPLAISFIILVLTWCAFSFSITIPEVLLHRHELWHFMFQAVTFNGLMCLTVLSLLTAATRSPGHPDPNLAPYAYRPESEVEAMTATHDRDNRSMAHTARSLPATLDVHQALSIGSVDDDGTDDIPLRQLRDSSCATGRVQKDRTSPLAFPFDGSRAEVLERPAPASASTSDLSPFRLALNPFVPTSATEAGDDSDWSEDEIADHGGTPPIRQRLRVSFASPADEPASRLTTNPGYDEALLDEVEGEVQALLLEQRRDGGQETRIALMAKSNTGGPRFCRKCEAWKPDRSHHCRFCKTCILRMDHHCIWLATCIGHRNYKPFLLFISYGTLLAIYTCLEAGYQNYIFFTTDTVSYFPSSNNPGTGRPGALPGSLQDEAGVLAGRAPSPPQVELAPIVWLLLTMAGGFFALSVGGLAVYHWYLVCNNLTTLEQITHSYPTALLPTPHLASTSTSAISGTSGLDSAPLSAAWKPDHLLTRSERSLLSEEAKEINVYDLGWRRNILQTLVGDQDYVSSTERFPGKWKAIRIAARAAWPLIPARNGDGHSFEHDERKLGRLRRLTEELRYGLPGHGGEEEEGGEDDSDGEADI